MGLLLEKRTFTLMTARPNTYGRSLPGASIVPPTVGGPHYMIDYLQLMRVPSLSDNELKLLKSPDL